MLNNIVDNLEQCGQQNIVQCCFHQARTGCAFFAVLCWTPCFCLKICYTSSYQSKMHQDLMEAVLISFLSMVTCKY